mgnify:CR=1 FL=1
MIISDFVEWELEKLRNECNFSSEELEFFNYRAKNKPIEQIAELMNISESKANKLSRKIKSKIIRIL